MEYSKKDMPKKAVRSIVNATLSNTLAELGISQTTAAYSRPKNIKDLLSKAKLHQAEGKEVSVYYSGGRLVNRQPPIFSQNPALASPGLRPSLACSGFCENIAFYERVREKSDEKHLLHFFEGVREKSDHF